MGPGWPKGKVEKVPFALLASTKRGIVQLDRLSRLPIFKTGRLDTNGLRYVAVRLATAILTLFFIMTILFILIRFVPGDPVSARFQAGSSLTAEQWAELRARAGLDKPIATQYAIYVGEMVRGDLGESTRFGDPVLALILDRLPATVILMSVGMLIGTTVGVFLGIASARKPNSARDNVIRLFALIGYSTPEFWLALLAMLTLSFHLGIFPISGMVDPRIETFGWAYVRSVAWHSILPVGTLSFFYIALFARFTRTSLLEQATENYVLTARAKGLDESRTFNRHILRNGLLPLVTMGGISMTYLFGGAVAIEKVFAWPGIGLLMFDALDNRDYPLLQGILFFSAVTVIVVNFSLDMVYRWVDPRVRVES